MFSPRSQTLVIIQCSEIIAKVSCDGDEIDFFVDEEGQRLELDSIITNLLALQ